MLTKLVLLGLAAVTAAQGVTSRIAPPVPAPTGCRVTDNRIFSITTVNATTSARRLKKRAGGMDKLTIQLSNGVLTSNRGDTGYIAANHQFQFDGPPQTGAIYTAGFSICPNNTLAIGDSTVFYSCVSGTFSNLYSTSQGKQCSQVFIEVLEGGAAPPSGPTTASPSSSPTPTVAPVKSIADNQPQASTAAPSASVSQINDNQPQAPTSAPTPTPLYTAGAPATGANLALAGGALLAVALL